MRVAVDGLSASVVGPTLYVVGGVDGLLQAYDSVRDRWTLKASMPTARRDLATGVVDGLIYAVGGRVDPWGFTDVVEVYDPRTDTWQKRAPLPQGRVFLGAATVAGKLYAVGGYNGTEIFSSLDAWALGPRRCSPMASSTASYAPMSRAASLGRPPRGRGPN